MTSKTKADCFAYNLSKGKCTALRDCYCDREECRFYKSKTAYEMECMRLYGRVGIYDGKRMAHAGMAY